MSGRGNVARGALSRWMRFNFVGLIGMAVQLGLVHLLVNRCEVDYQLATLAAVEVAVLHNFCWHLRFTWNDRRLDRSTVILRRLVEFNLSNGAVSLAGSWTMMTLLVSRAGVPVIAANLISIGACSILNFILAEALVFRAAPRRPRRRVLGLRSQCLDI